MVTSVHHLTDAPTVRLERAVRALIIETLAAEAARMPELLAAPDGDCAVRVHENGVFVDIDRRRRRVLKIA